MTLVDRILSEPEFHDRPPVLVDVGAAAGVPRLWRQIARHAVVIAFEPDSREAAPLTSEQRAFRRWIYVPAVVVAEPADQVPLHLTRSPQCSSTLRPASAALSRWQYAPYFDVVETKVVPATTLGAVIEAHALGGVDWLKCDTQGLDLRIFMSLPPAVRRRVLMVEFEPGLIEAYVGEDAMGAVLTTMREEPYLLSECGVEQTPLAAPSGLGSRWYQRLAPPLPGWANLRYLRDIDAAALDDRRSSLLLWVLATLQRQPAYACHVAAAGKRRFGPALFQEMERVSRIQVRRAMLRRLPMWMYRRIGRSFA